MTSRVTDTGGVNDQLDARACNDLCRALLDTLSKHTNDSRIMIMALANVSGNVVASHPQTTLALENFMNMFGQSLTDYSKGSTRVELVGTTCAVHGDNCPKDTVH